jgi:phosphoketolase
MAPVVTDAKRKTAAGSQAAAEPLSADELRKMDAYFRALNYLSVGQIYLLDNPLLKEPSSASISSRGCSATGARRRA